MNEADNIERVVRALQKVPEKKLLIIELVNQIPIKYGELDCAVLAERQPEVNLAIAEAKAYGANTIMAVESLVMMRAREEV